MGEREVGLLSKLASVQSELKVPKDLYNNFGRYNYRSAEGILEALKPLLKKNGLALKLSDEVVQIGSRFYVMATATVTDVETGLSTDVTAYAREDETKKGMDGSQITGTASSYARKYALNGLFLIDDTKDNDTDENHNERKARAKKADADRQDMLDKIRQLAKEKDISESDVCAIARVKKLEDLEDARLPYCIKYLEDM